MSQDPDLTGAELVAGLSIDDRVLRVAVVRRSDPPTVVDAAEVDLDAGVVQDGRVLDQPALARRIGEAWRVLELGGVPTFVGLHPVDSVVRALPVDGWPEGGKPAEVLAVVGALRDEHGAEPVWNADRLDIDDVEVARVVACRREDLSNGMWAARRSGVWIVGVELTGLALVRAVPVTPEPYVVLLDASGPGAATVVLLDQGTAVRVWRVPLSCCPAVTGSLVRVAIDIDTAVQLAHAETAPLEWVSSCPWEQSQPVGLLGPGSGLAPDSGVPLPAFAGALGLALAGVGVGAARLDLQPSLLTTGVASLQAQLAGRTLDLRGADSDTAAPPPAAPPPAAPPPAAPAPAVAEPVAPESVAPESVAIEHATPGPQQEHAPESEADLLGALFRRKDEPAPSLDGERLASIVFGDPSPGGEGGREGEVGPSPVVPLVIGDVDGVAGRIDGGPALVPSGVALDAVRRHRMRRLLTVLVVAAVIGAVAFFVVRTVTAGAAVPTTTPAGSSATGPAPAYR